MVVLYNSVHDNILQAARVSERTRKKSYADETLLTSLGALEHISGEYFESCLDYI